MKHIKRYPAFLLAFFLLFSLLPFSAFAEDTSPIETEEIAEDVSSVETEEVLESTSPVETEEVAEDPSSIEMEEIAEDVSPVETEEVAEEITPAVEEEEILNTANGDLTITVNRRLYPMTSENSGGSHYTTSGGSYEQLAPLTITVPAGTNRSFDIPLDRAHGVITAFLPTGFSRDTYYTNEGNLHITVADSVTAETATITLYLGDDFTSRFVQYRYLSEDGVNFTYDGLETAAAPTGGSLEASNNYAASAKLDKTGVKPNPPEGYHYAGRYYLALMQGGSRTYVNPSDYGFAINESTGELTGPTYKLTGNQYFEVMYYYVKDGEDLKGNFYRYYYFDDVYDESKLVRETPAVGSEVSMEAPYFAGYKFDSKQAAIYQNGSWVNYPYNTDTDTVTQVDGYLAGFFYYVSATPYQVTYVSNENSDGTGTVYDGGLVYEEAPYSILGTDQTGFSRDGYTFTGWNTEPDGSGTSYSPEDSLTMPASDLTFYAQWRLNLTVDAVGYEGTYDGKPHSISAQANQDATLTYSIDGGNTWTETLPTATDVSEVSVLVQAANDYEEVISNPVVLKINPVTLIVKADSFERKVGEENPTLTGTITGFIDGEDASVLSGEPSYSTEATKASPAGTYDITAAPGTLSAANYVFEFMPGTLTVKADTVVPNQNSSKTSSRTTPKSTVLGKGSPRTADTSDIMLWIMLLFFCLSLVGVMTYRKN